MYIFQAYVLILCMGCEWLALYSEHMNISLLALTKMHRLKLLGLLLLKLNYSKM